MTYIEKVVIGDCTLYHGDSTDILSIITGCDAMVTDPPYGYGKPSGTIGKKSKNKRDYSSFEDKPEFVKSIYVPIVNKSLEICNGRGIITPGNKHYFEYPPAEAMGCFFQPASTGMCTWGRSTMQPILYYGRDPKIGKTIKSVSYTLTEQSDKSIFHPCAKPIKAWSWIVDRASLEGETILDPFMGSGTTGVSCVKLGRKFVGIEIDKNYFEISCQRIRDAYAQPDMFLTPTDNHP